MSKRVALFAKDLRPGDNVRLVYEIVVSKADDLDTIIPSESGNLLFIEGTVTKGPLRGQSGSFAILGDDKLDVIIRKPNIFVLLDRFKEWFHPTPKTSKRKSKVKAEPA